VNHPDPVVGDWRWYESVRLGVSRQNAAADAELAFVFCGKSRTHGHDHVGLGEITVREVLVVALEHESPKPIVLEVSGVVLACIEEYPGSAAEGSTDGEREREKREIMNDDETGPQRTRLVGEFGHPLRPDAAVVVPELELDGTPDFASEM